MKFPSRKSMRDWLVAKAMAGIVVQQPDGKIVSVDRAFCRMSGYTRDELLTMHFSQLLESKEADITDCSRLTVSGQLAHSQVRIQHRDGHRFLIKTIAKSLKNGKIQITGHEISERVETRQQLADERNFIRQAINSLPGVFYVFDRKGQKLLWNDTFEKISGYGADEQIHLPLGSLIVPEQRAMIVERFAEAFTQGHADAEVEMQTRDGRRIPYYVTGRCFEWQGETVLAGMGVNISARVAAERALKESQRHYQDLVEQAQDGIFLRRETGELLFVNSALCELTGYSRDELLHMTVFDLADIDDAEMLKQVRRSNAGQNPLRESRLRQKKGGVVPVEVNTQRLANGDIQGIVRDIHERVETTQRLQEYSAELKSLSLRLTQAQEEERRNIARELHDEVGASLTAMQFMLSRLQNEAGTTAGRESMQQILATLSQLSAQIRELSLNLRPSVLDDLGLAAAVRWYAREQSRNSGVTIEADMPDDLMRFAPHIETACFRVLQGALTNVLRHAKARVVEITLCQSGNTLEMVVKDDGAGFDVAAARAHAVQGNSLGLLAMEERVRLTGGEIAIHSVPKHGTEVSARFTVPAKTMT
ncbi:MAG: PAS domain S-box protein [Gammaproteobacteria bacterium]